MLIMIGLFWNSAAVICAKSTHFVKYKKEQSIHLLHTLLNRMRYVLTMTSLEKKMDAHF